MSTPSPPKPWERGGGGGTTTTTSTGIKYCAHLLDNIVADTIPAVPSSTSTQPTTTTTTTIAPSNSSTAPAVPQRPSSLNNVVNRTASNYSTPASTLANRPYGSSPYGYGGYGSSPYGYSSPYSRFGAGYGTGMYGGGMYGGGMYGGGMFGGGGMYGGGMAGPMQGDPNDPNSMTNNFAQSTQATFQIIESIVGAFGGFAQMLESTYMATHSSFFAMVSVAEQFGNLRQTLGSVLGIYTLIRWFRTLFAKVSGRPPPADATSLTPANFAAFTGVGPATLPDGRPAPPKPSKKPFIFFILAVFGLPYLMGKLIRALAKGQEEAMREQGHQQGQIGSDGQLRPATLDPSKLDFCRVLYDFPPPEALANGSFDSGLDLEVKTGDLVAVLDKSDPDGNGGNEGQWWRCRARDGRMGYLPAVYLETIQRRQQPAQITAKESGSQPSSRAQTMAGTGQTSSRTNTLYGSTANESRAQTISSETATTKGKVDVKFANTNGIEKFQKAWVNDN